MSDTRGQSAGKTDEVTDVEIGWLVGIWDGEGTIAAVKVASGAHWGIQSSMTNTDFAVIERVADILKRLQIGHFVTKSRSDFPMFHRERKSVVIAGHKRNATFLPTVVPHLTGEKQVKGRLALCYITSRMNKPGGGRQRGGVPLDEREEEIINLLRNFKGNPNEHTRELTDRVNMMCSELLGDQESWQK